MEQALITAKEIALAVIEELKVNEPSTWIDSEVHALQHQFIAEMIAERKERSARRERIREKIAGSVILTALMGIVGLIGVGALEWLRKNLG